MELKAFFESEQRDYDAYSWTHLTAGDEEEEGPAAFAAELADRIMEDRCPSHHYEAWVDCRDNGTPLPESVARALQYSIGSVFGTPGDRAPDNQYQGYVAEALWRFLTAEHAHRYEVVYLEWGWDPTDSGPDGFIVHRLDEDLGFRLWEVKKSTGADGIAPVIQKAVTQVSERAAFYLARLSKSGPTGGDPRLQPLFDYLVEYWLRTDQRASAGVSIASSEQRIPDPCFHQLPQTLPAFANPSRLRGLWVAVPDFPALCASVRSAVWIGL